jgi:ceroid-lipofuscinosis MFS transporter 7
MQCLSFFVAVVGRRPQGTLLGWFASAGSFARLIFPITSGYVEYYLSLTTLFYILTVGLLISSLVTFYNQKTLLDLSS